MYQMIPNPSQFCLSNAEKVSIFHSTKNILEDLEIICKIFHSNIPHGMKKKTVFTFQLSIRPKVTLDKEKVVLYVRFQY